MFSGYGLATVYPYDEMSEYVHSFIMCDSQSQARYSN